MLVSQFISLSPSLGFPGGSVVKNPPVDEGDKKKLRFNLWGRCPVRGNGNLLQYACLENSMDRGTWRATDHGFTKSCTWLTEHSTLHDYILLDICSLKEEVKEIQTEGTKWAWDGVVNSSQSTMSGSVGKEIWGGGCHWRNRHTRGWVSTTKLILRKCNLFFRKWRINIKDFGWLFHQTMTNK